MKIFYNKIFKNYCLLSLSLFLTEMIFKCVCGLNILDWSTLRVFIGINLISLILGFIFSLCGRIIGNILTSISIIISCIYSLAQAGFLNYVGVFMSFGTATQAGAVRDYFGDYINSFKWNFWLLLLPILLVIIYYIYIEKIIYTMEMNDTIDFADKFDSEERKKINEKNAKKAKRNSILANRVSAIILIAALTGAYYATFNLSFMQNGLQLKSNKALFKNPDLPNIAMSQFGVNMYAMIDVKNVLFPRQEPEPEAIESFNDEYEKPTQIISDYSRQIDDSVWELINQNETNKNYKTLNNYYMSQEITDKNDYTGMFKGKNLIVIMMESVDNIILNKEYFPNIYKLYNEGWSWDNAYSPRNSCSTGNNEMSGMTSLYTINNSCTANNYKNNLYPNSLFNLFNNAGYTTTSYHNYTEQYYYRKTIHTNMGSSHYYGVQELGIPYSNEYQEWPSDVELIDKMLKITDDQKQFMAWITTVSSHQPYTQKSELGDLYIDLFSNTSYNTSLKRYLSKLKVLDNAIGTLIDGLKERRKLDDTVIVLYADHYPYGLTTNTLNSYFDYDVTEKYEVDRTPFIIYNSEITASKFEQYTSYMNILPTIANLFDLEYDPRIYAGKDILDKHYENRIIFADGSWQDDIAFYNATSGKITYVTEAKTYTTEEIQNINNNVRNRITMSNLAIKTNYFNYLAEKREEYKVSSIEEVKTAEE